MSVELRDCDAVNVVEGVPLCERVWLMEADDDCDAVKVADAVPV